MAALNIILLVLFIIVCILIVFLVLLQNEEGDSIGRLFAGGSNSAFGSRSGNVLTKSTYVLVTIFFTFSFILAVLNKSSSSPSERIKKEGQELQQKEATPWYDTEKKEQTKGTKAEGTIEEDKNRSGTTEKSGAKEGESSSVDNAQLPTVEEMSENTTKGTTTEELEGITSSDIEKVKEETKDATNATPKNPVNEEMKLEVPEGDIQE